MQNLNEKAITINVTDEELAIHGGSPAIPAGPPTWPIADESVRVALQSAFEDGSWGRYHGPHCEYLTTLLAEMHSVDHVMLCCSGTFGVELALRSLQIANDDEVILAGYDFSGNFRCIEAVGARPVLVDIDPRTWCLDAAHAEDAISEKTKAIIISHLHGGLASMREICDVSARHGLVVIEDACQAPGAVVDGRIAGTWGDVGVLSFGGSKLLTAGRGGAILTKSANAYQRAKVFCERGNDAFPLSELQAAVLVPQVAQLPAKNEQRLQNVQHLRDQVENLSGLQAVSNLSATGDNSQCYYKFAWLYDATAFGDHSREQIIDAIQAEGVAVDAGFRGFTRRSGRRCRKVGTLESSEAASTNTLLLHHPVLLESAETIDRVSLALKKVVTAFTS